MPVYRKKGRSECWTVVIHHGGKRKDFVVQGTKADAVAFEARKRVELQTIDPGALRVVPTLSDFCATQYRAHAELRLGADTWYKQQFILADLIAVLGDEKLDRAGTAPVADEYARVRLRDGLKAVSVNNELRVLRRIVNVARERGIPVPPPRFQMLPEDGSPRVKVWTEDEVSRLLAACATEAPSITPLVVFLLNTGCRKGEALSLRWTHVDLERGLIEIWPGEGWQPKNKLPREVTISDSLLPFLKGNRRSERWVFPASTGERYAHWPKLQFDRARKAAGLVGGPHTCRHTYASHYLKEQPDLYLLASVLGHSDIAVTRLYAHLLPDHLERSRNVVNFAPGAVPTTTGMVDS